ncbi:MAG: enoyl-CoA hydratase/isomerase family protein [Acidimicrobiia bacterium]|nr:enoyl-CoA hydratase/isomerase family protein [Acidimicrobiia bacterium]
MTAVRFHDDKRGFRSILLDRPRSRNAINRDVVEGIRRGLADADAPIVVLGSTDHEAFSSGADLKLPDRERAEVSESLYRLYREMRLTPKIVIAAASGPAIGGGAQLLIASDLRIVSSDAQIRFVGPGHGLVVGAWGLPSLVGRGRSLDICLSMRPIDAEEALSIGLVDRVVADPLAQAMDYASSVAALDHSAVAAAKRVVSVSGMDEALEQERDHNSSWRGEVPSAR